MCDACVIPKLYRNYHIAYLPKPIPIRKFDYDYWHDDYDLGDPRQGNAESIADAMSQIDEIEKELLNGD